VTRAFWRMFFAAPGESYPLDTALSSSHRELLQIIEGIFKIWLRDSLRIFDGSVPGVGRRPLRMRLPGNEVRPCAVSLVPVRLLDLLSRRDIRSSRLPTRRVSQGNNLFCESSLANYSSLGGLIRPVTLGPHGLRVDFTKLNAPKKQLRRVVDP
jgi:hypothetical protein